MLSDINPDKYIRTLEKGSRARRIIAMGVKRDLEERRAKIWKQAEDELIAGTLTPERALVHVACSNALRRYPEELTSEVEKAERAAQKLHAKPDEPEDAGY